ncbi:hypothetical protein DL93DRAFT_234 [Clavulina sp. PMI_390]|nr:hypothetical protein DL93DRAFT_234 [Clavulina sp. PMI_390]
MMMRTFLQLTLLAFLVRLLQLNHGDQKLSLSVVGLVRISWPNHWHISYRRNPLLTPPPVESSTNTVTFTHSHHSINNFTLHGPDDSIIYWVVWKGSNRLDPESKIFIYKPHPEHADLAQNPPASTPTALIPKAFFAKLKSKSQKSHSTVKFSPEKRKEKYRVTQVLTPVKGKHNVRTMETEYGTWMWTTDPKTGAPQLWDENGQLLIVYTSNSFIFKKSRRPTLEVNVKALEYMDMVLLGMLTQWDDEDRL